MKISNFATKRVNDWTVELKPIYKDYKDYSIYGIVQIKLEQSHQKMKSGQMTLWFENFTTNCPKKLKGVLKLRLDFWPKNWEFRVFPKYAMSKKLASQDL